LLEHFGQCDIDVPRWIKATLYHHYLRNTLEFFTVGMVSNSDGSSIARLNLNQVLLIVMIRVTISFNVPRMWSNRLGRSRANQPEKLAWREFRH
ncbi:MAG: hypothetical protein ACRESZ_05875, partial [Methylococcales bacterium]